MGKPLRHAFWGFFFGTIALYVFSALALILPFVEYTVQPLMWPGRWAAITFAGADGNNMEVMLLSFFNGVIYALLFMTLGIAFGRTRPT